MLLDNDRYEEAIKLGKEPGQSSLATVLLVFV